MPKAESTDNLLTHKLYTNVSGERIAAVLEMTRKTDNSPLHLKKILSLSLVAIAAAQALAEPTGGQVVKGQAQINQTGTQGGTVTTIKQSTPQVSINWQSFSVGEKERVNFVQPDASSLAINRILGSQGSSIQGDINANGQVWLINPNGIVFGKNAQVNVGGLVATTLDTANPGSMTGTQRFSGNSTAAVTNSGLLSASEGGYVALLGHRVSNQGEINAPAATVAMGAGSAVDLQFNNNQLIGVQVYESLLDAMADNGGVIRAAAGQVLLKAGAQGSLLRSAVNNSGVIQGRTVRKQGGKIVLVSGMKTGVTTISGTLDASSTDDGNGGFIETSGNKVQISDSSSITTRSAGGKNGNWLIDPDDFVVAARGGNISGAVLSAALNSNDVTIQTTDGQSQVTGVTNSANTQGNGDILVNDTVSWTANTKLTLNAYRNILVNSPITSSNANGSLAVKYGQGSGDGRLDTVMSTFTVNSPIGLKAGYNFAAQKGSRGANNIYLVITALGSQTDNSAGSTATNSLQSRARSANLSGYYALGADIDASATAGWNSGKGFAPIGSFSGTGFSGLFEGLGHQISGLTINNPTKNYMGMFGYSTSQLISNLRLNNLNIKGNIYTGGLVGRYASGGQIFNVSATGNVSGYSSTGGLIGSLDSGSLDLGSFTGNAISRAGGIKLGGIAGALGGGGAINRSFFDGNLNGANTVGGLVGDSQGAINQSYANIAFDVSTAKYVGGLVGTNNGSINNSYATGHIVANSIAGGLVGFNNIGGVQNSYSLVAMFRNSDIDFGSLVGTDYLGTYINTYYDVSINPGMAGPGTGLTHAQFFQNSSFQGMDFDNKWFSYDGHTAPLLRAFLKPLEVTVSVSGRKTYDGTTACATVVCSYTTSATSPVSESHLLGTAVTTLSSKNAGTVNVGSFTGLYSDQQGYLITTKFAGEARIDKADLTVTATQVSKTYDGTTTASGSGSVGTIAGANAGESVKTAGSQFYLDKNAGKNKTVRASGVAIKDSDNADVSSNYNIRYEDNTSSAIDKADLTVTATKVRKTYDGTTAANGTGNVGTLAGAGAGESVKTAGSQVFLDKSAGSNKTVRASGVTIKDSDNLDVSANYNITYVDNTGSSINKLMLESVSHPIQQFNQIVAPSFNPIDMLVVNQMGNASPSNFNLMVPAALQKDLAWPSNQTPSTQIQNNPLQINPSQNNPSQNNPLPGTPSSKKDNDDEK